MLPRPNWSWLPLFHSLSSFIGFCIVFIISKTLCHIEEWWFPYISHMGTNFPEDMLFSTFLSFEGFIGMIVVFIAWRYMRQIGQRDCLNTIAVICGFISCIGICIVGNFQVTRAWTPHYVGAFMGFSVGTIYIYLATHLCYRIWCEYKKRLHYLMWVVRCCLAIISTLGFIIMAIVHAWIENYEIDTKTEYLDFTNHSNPYCRKLAQDVINGNNPQLKQVPKHSKEYLQISLVGAMAEWLIGLSFLGFLGLYTYEFKKFEHIKVQLIRQNRPLSLEPLKASIGRKDAETQFVDLTKTSRPSSRTEETISDRNRGI